MTTRRPHSVDVLGDFRDHLWSDDFLALMAERLSLGQVRRALDVGAGHGHWGLRLLGHLSSEAALVSLDREARWQAVGQSRAAALGYGERTDYQLGSAEQMPFADASFGLVTCQTLLMHVADPLRVLSEMLRVLEPGGLLLLSEPNNLVNTLYWSSNELDTAIDDQCALVRLAALVQRGKRVLGHGDHSIGQRLPRYLHQLGVDDLRVHHTDQCSPLIPPYAADGQVTLIEQLRKRFEADLIVTCGDKSQTEECFVAGGGQPDEFERYWQVASRHMRAMLAGIDAGTYVTPGGFAQYLVSARKRAQD